MRKLFIGVILILNGIAYYSNYTLSGQQTAKTAKFEDRYTLSGIIFDSMVYEVQKGRSCEVLVIKQRNQIQILTDLTGAQETRIQLLNSKIDALNSSLILYHEQYVTLQEQSKIKLKQSRSKTFKVILVAVAEGLVIIFLL